MNNDWMYDVLEFYNEIWTIWEIYEDDEKRMEDKLISIIDCPISSNFIAMEYIERKCKYILTIMWQGEKYEDVIEYINTMRKEWNDIIVFYNLNKKRSKENE